MRKAPCLAVFGTGSDVGKSIIVTALARFFLRKGIQIAPFKAQNMSNNSGVTPEGLEMGRAQIVQAESAGIPPHVDMNPVLLKPTTEIGCQVVVLGKAMSNETAKGYHKKKNALFATAAKSLDRLKNQYDLVVMEGAGSCAEVNLMENDIVNFPMAEYAKAPVILVADIHKGGVFAQIVGTMECLPAKYKEMIAGFIINRFRGDIRLFENGVKWIEKKTGKKVFGVLPWFSHFRIEAEDSVVIEKPLEVAPENIRKPAIAVIRIPHISNFTDFDPLSEIEGLNLYFVEKAGNLNEFSAIIIPGSKNTRFDLNWLNDTGWADRLKNYAKKGGCILGICGGYQMMGMFVHDPHGLEGPSGVTRGLGLLPVVTTLKAPKTTTLTHFSWNGKTGRGYEIHMGITELLGGNPLFSILEQNSIPRDVNDGCITKDGKIMGTYIHGLFDMPEITETWLELIGLKDLGVPGIKGLCARERSYNLLADHFERYIDTDSITELCI